MCGIVGAIIRNNKIDKNLFEKMLEQIIHRGPESGGTWYNKKDNVAFGHRRLAIIDLSVGGYQPMLSDDGRFIITYNGEIYNYKELKEELIRAGIVFKTESDTEVLLTAYIQWGQECLQKINGMFAFAIWDTHEQKLFAARDRLGEKPFKYYFDGEKFVFASEIKAIVADPDIKGRVDWQAIDKALSFRFVGAPETGFLDIKKLPAGHYLMYQGGEVVIKQYWDIGDAKDLYKGSILDLKKDIWALFVESVKKRMIADVPVGAFLSGGVDSTSVIAAMKELGIQNINTFVISIGGRSEDQKYASVAAKYFGTNHHEIELRDINYQNALKNLVSHYDEPFFDQSALPTMLISQEIKKYGTVVLSGDGGDELFGGYEAYKFLKYIKFFSKFQASFRKMLPSLFCPISKSWGYKTEVMSKENFIESYSEYCAVWKTFLPISKKYITKDDLYLAEFKNIIDVNGAWQSMVKWFGDTTDSINNAMIADIRGRLADGYLTKTDIASMSSAVELRAPFLDYRLVELSGRIPSGLKIRYNNEKWLWKQVVRDKIPTEIINRKKIGFSIPLHIIIKTELKTMIEDNILSSNSRIAEVFSVNTIKQLWSDHLKNKADYSNHLWSLLILELWLKKYLGK